MFKRFIFLAAIAALLLPMVFQPAEADKRVYTRAIVTYACSDSQPTFLPEASFRTRDAQGRAFLKILIRFKSDAQDLGGSADFRAKFLPSWTSAYSDTGIQILPHVTPGVTIASVAGCHRQLVCR